MHNHEATSIRARREACRRGCASRSRA
jgi:hypothetical protein